MATDIDKSEALEVFHYTQDPEHRLLNELMTRIACPKKRRKILEIFESVAETPASIEEIRASVLAVDR